MAKVTGLARFYYATKYSIKGISAAFKHEPAFQYEVYGFLVLFPASFWVAQTATQWALLVSVCLLVLILELINSAIEAVVDRAGTEFNELAGRAKDLGSAAVMFGLLITAAVWGGVIWDNGGLF
ncbi:diacylglycerol kinase [Neptunomonas japonica]|uniref:Diacylglycerol kinase n=1 Tax=Neptunomonas japonica JAMM 1380 TaxID=1441457 RepID=A0A7R6PHB0_9GAMM|nr:diacylglycerol kinase [Neptunomonas japonica]BBB29136.1 diacylglycerol kinase (ATP dependent) [Neptunomonas japonica JAMM 1380]